MTFTLPSELELGEVKLKVTNLERSLQFYENVVGLKLVRQEANAAYLTAADGQRILLVLEEVAGGAVLPRRSVSGLYHFAILVPTRQALGLALRNLIDSGIHIGQADHLVSEALYISDPDNNGIEIYRDRPRYEWPRQENGQVKMASDPIDWEGLLEEAKDFPWSGLPTGTVIGHVHFHVADLERAKAFYCHLLGFEIATDGWREMGALFIAAGGYHHHIGLNIWAGVGAPPAPENAAGLAYFTIKLHDANVLTQVVARLHEAGIAAEERDGSWYAQDPFGINIRLTV
ncbi:catechol 2,3-dioxygenase [Paenibacillus phyllosphaerae]|uniref:Catechol 2,3-dioxygenase n=1 Tax=Paenibacillus phyllosphaerae TaxID=274593 RepID=A0A7W5FRP5_9BACL|nr:VOC family protein [Paenibacillus phyllosphaerae]MBB3114746.1 catechol 2,3-dioxygenase [Paenibacillus phyllosphaerae]